MAPDSHASKFDRAQHSAPFRSRLAAGQIAGYFKPDYFDGIYIRPTMLDNEGIST